LDCEKSIGSEIFMKLVLLSLIACVAPLFNSCSEAEPERKAVPPTSPTGNMPWNIQSPHEGTGQFGGMLERR
jgi:hypothetical protein